MDKKTAIRLIVIAILIVAGISWIVYSGYKEMYEKAAIELNDRVMQVNASYKKMKYSLYPALKKGTLTLDRVLLYAGEVKVLQDDFLEFELDTIFDNRLIYEKLTDLYDAGFGVAKKQLGTAGTFVYLYANGVTNDNFIMGPLMEPDWGELNSKVSDYVEVVNSYNKKYMSAKVVVKESDFLGN